MTDITIGNTTIEREDVLPKEVIEQRLATSVNLLNSLGTEVNNKIKELERVQKIVGQSDYGDGLIKGLDVALELLIKYQRGIVDVSIQAYPELADHFAPEDVAGVTLPGEED